MRRPVQWLVYTVLGTLLLGAQPSSAQHQHLPHEQLGATLETEGVGQNVTEAPSDLSQHISLQPIPSTYRLERSSVTHAEGSASDQSTPNNAKTPPRTSKSSRAIVSSPSSVRHARHRHGHAGIPKWLRKELHREKQERKNWLAKTILEEKIADVFRDVAYLGIDDRHPPIVRHQRRPSFAATGNVRIERTTTLSESPPSLAHDSASSANQRLENVTTPSSVRENELNKTGHNNQVSQKTPEKDKDVKSVEDILQVEEYDREMYDMYEGHYADLNDTTQNKSETSTRGDVQTHKSLETQLHSEQNINSSSEPNTTQSSVMSSGPQRSRTRWTWFDCIVHSSQSVLWTTVNLLLGLILLLISLLAPYRLLTIRSCTPLLPRSHYVTVLLLVFVAASLKAVYLFHLAHGSKERLPLILVLLLTNSGYPCLISAFLILMIMMFLTADVQVYKPKLFTVHNIFIFIVMQIVLCFVADVIVGCAHSKTVLVMARVMIIAIALIVVCVYVRKHQMVLQVSQMLRREFQGELKLLVLPSNDSSQQKQMGIKYILRNHLGMWCLVMKISAVCVVVLSVVHLFHTIFLISSHVPAWAWWTFHLSGCLVESVLCVLLCLAAALTQRYDETVHFVYSFMVPPILVNRKKSERVKESNEEAIYQRVSFSSGTESTQYTTCYPEAAPVVVAAAQNSVTPKPSKRHGVQVKRSATFSHAPHHPHALGYRYRPLMVPQRVLRTNSASQIPVYGPFLGSHMSIYDQNLVTHVPIYSPPSDVSMLVHEDGFVRVRMQRDPREEIYHDRRPQIILHDSHFQGTGSPVYGPPTQYLNGPDRQESCYQSLPRKRRTSRSSDILIHSNVDIPEDEFQSSTSSHRNYMYHPSYRASPAPSREGDYPSMSRRRRSSREPTTDYLNNVEREDGDYHSLSRRKRSGRDSGHYHMNNLDRPEGNYHRQVSREVNNDTVYHRAPYKITDPDYSVLPGSRRSMRDSRHLALNLYEDQNRPYISTHSPSSSSMQKVSNYAVVPSSSSPIAPLHNFTPGVSPRTSKRQAQFPRPFVRVASNTSLHGNEGGMNTDYFPSGKPVRRNHSSAGYYPSRELAPPSPSLNTPHRYGSLRLGVVKKRGPGYYEGGVRRARFEDTPIEARESESPAKMTDLNGSVEGEGPPHERRECPSRQSSSSKHSEGAEQDLASEIIQSSSLLTDFYSLDRAEMKRRKARKRENIPEHKESE